METSQSMMSPRLSVGMGASTKGKALEFRYDSECSLRDKGLLWEDFPSEALSQLIVENK